MNLSDLSNQEIETKLNRLRVILKDDPSNHDYSKDYETLKNEYIHRRQTRFKPHKVNSADIIAAAPWNRRVMAYGIDGAVYLSIGLICFFLVSLVGLTSGGFFATLNNPPLALKLSVAVIIFSIHSWLLFKYQASIGKMAMKLRVISLKEQETEKLSKSQAILRTVVGFPILFLDNAVQFFNYDRRHLTDKVLHTKTINLEGGSAQFPQNRAIGSVLLFVALPGVLYTVKMITSLFSS